MAKLETASLCTVHPNCAAIALCDHCSKPLCSQCRVEDVAPEEVFCSPERRKTHAATRTKKTINERELIDGFHHPFWGGLETMGPFSGHPCHGLCAASGQFVPWAGPLSHLSGRGVRGYVGAGHSGHLVGGGRSRQ